MNINFLSYIVTPRLNKSTIVQALGRVVMNQLLDLLKEDEWSIHVYNRMTLASNTNECVRSINIKYKYYVCEEKTMILRRHRKRCKKLLY